MRAAPRLLRLASLLLAPLLCACPAATTRAPGSAPDPAALPGCGRDTDCKGARVCERGRCVDPHPGTSAAVAAPPAEARAEPPSPPALGPAPMFRLGPQHTGRSAYRAPIRAPSEAWRFTADGVLFSSPAVAEDGSVIFGSHDRHVYAVDGKSGALRWKFETRDLVWTSPALGPGVVYVGSDDDTLYALDLKDGALRWKIAPGACRRSVGIGPEAARCDIDQITVGPDGTIYSGGDGVYAIKPDGTLRWRFQPSGRTHCAAAPAVAPDGTIYAGCQDDAVYALAPDGARRWEYRGQDDFDSSPAIGPDGTVYVGSDDKRLYAFAPDGKLRFAVVTEGPVRASPAIAADGTVYVGSYDGAFYAVRPDGSVAWTFRCADRIHGSALVDATGTILFGAQDDRLYALDPTGKLLWSVLLDGDVDATPVLGADGTIYVGGDDRTLHALR